MSVDLTDLVPSLRREVNPPGQELFPDATNAILLGYLSDSFWLGKLDGFYGGYSESDGIVINVTEGGDDLSRDWQQLIVFYAGMKIIENSLRNTNTLFRAKAGPVEYETQNSASLLRVHLEALYDRRDALITQLSQQYSISVGYVDMLCARTNALAEGLTGFASGMGFNDF